ncbi:hypothetical protein GP486_008588, partial [Trichoglossum hirsutum]
AKASQESRQRRGDPVDICLVPCPSEPEQTPCERYAANYHRRQSPLRNGYVVIRLEFAVVRRLQRYDEGACQKLAYHHAKVRQSRDARFPASNLLEDDGVGGQEEIEEAVDEGHVYGEEKDDWLGEEEAKGSGEVLGHEFGEVDFYFFLLCVDAPILGAPAELGGLGDEDHRRRVVLEDETSDEGSQEWAREHGHREDGDGQPTLPVAEHVREYGCHHGQRTGSKEPAPEPTEQHSLEVLPRSGGDLEDGESEHGYYEGEAASFEFGERGPERGARGEAENVETETEETDFSGDVVFVSHREGGGREDTAGEGNDEGRVSEDEGGIDSGGLCGDC